MTASIAIAQVRAALDAIDAETGLQSTSEAQDWAAHVCLINMREILQTYGAMEARVLELEAALKEGRRAIGDHFAPEDCYATGPLTGNAIRDLVQCPACSFLGMFTDLTAITQKTPEIFPGTRAEPDNLITEEKS